MTLYQAFMKVLAKCIYRKPEFIFEEPLPEGEPLVFTANHSAADGPVITSLYFPRPCRPWSIAQILDKRTAPGFIYYDFFAGPVKKHKKLWRVLSHLVAFLLRPLLLAVNGIPVYHDKRIMNTLSESLEALDNGTNLVIFPECPEKFSEHINDFYGGFAKLAELYYKKHGKPLKFYPTYIAHSLRTVMVGKAIEAPPPQELPPSVWRKHIAETLRDRTEALAASLPPHKVTPFLTDEWYEAYGKYWSENRMQDYWKLSENELKNRSRKSKKLKNE